MIGVSVPPDGTLVWEPGCQIICDPLCPAPARPTTT